MTKEQLAKLGITIEKEEITEEEAQKLIEEKFTSLNGDIKKHKDLLSQRNSEIADYKRKEQDKLTEEEKTKLFYQNLEETNKKLQRSLALNEKVKEYMAIGYSEDLATKVATAELDGKSTAQYHKEFMTAREESLRAEILQKSPQPKTDVDTKPLTKDDLGKMTYTELMKVQETQPELFNEFVASQNNKK